MQPGTENVRNFRTKTLPERLGRKLIRMPLDPRRREAVEVRMSEGLGQAVHVAGRHKDACLARQDGLAGAAGIGSDDRPPSRLSLDRRDAELLHVGNDQSSGPSVETGQLGIGDSAQELGRRAITVSQGLEIWSSANDLDRLAGQRLIFYDNSTDWRSRFQDLSTKQPGFPFAP